MNIDVAASSLFFISIPRAREKSFIGLSALAVETYGIMLNRPFVRPSVRSFMTTYLEIRASDFNDFLHKATFC